MKLSALHLVAASAAAALLAAIAAPVQAQDQTLPDGPGKAELEATCAVCHGLNLVTARHRSAAEWADVLTQMESRGAVMDDKTKPLILGYLTTNLGTGDAAAAPGAPAAPATPPATPTPPQK